MDENPGLSDQYRMASPWPLFVALGLPIAEIGILFDLPALSIGGLLLFCGSISGMVQESGYAETPWRPLAACAVLLFAFGGLFFYADAQIAAEGIRFLARGWAVVVAGGILLLSSVVGSLLVDRPEPI
ncbi:DUF7541 family protein [Halegenticoccus tardaugens]|uniref:DUF7541 family protein n=1 Tax=Halegenticoccus tardaugens TaxID=2071624 RepID=UPI00100BBDF7|nr:cox cluster protein [Halegenticoccus tardaugens]